MGIIKCQEFIGEREGCLVTRAGCDHLRHIPTNYKAEYGSTRLGEKSYQADRDYN